MNFIKTTSLLLCGLALQTATAQEKNYKGDNPGSLLNNIGDIHRDLGDVNKALDFYMQVESPQ